MTLGAVRALALMMLLFIASALIWTVGWLLGASSWWGPLTLWLLAALYAVLTMLSAQEYRRWQYDARMSQRGTERLLGYLRGTRVVRLYDPPTSEALADGWDMLWHGRGPS